MYLEKEELHLNADSSHVSFCKQKKRDNTMAQMRNVLSEICLDGKKMFSYTKEHQTLHCPCDVCFEPCISFLLTGSLLYGHFSLRDVGGSVSSWTHFTRSHKRLSFLPVS